MPIPFIAAGVGLGAGIVAAYNYFKEDDKKDTKSKSQVKETLSPQQEKELDFLIRLAISAAYADGVLCKDERSLIEGFINEAKEQYEHSDFFEDLLDKFEQPDSFDSLNRRWNALDIDHTVFVNKVKQVIDADKQRTDAENAFLYRCNLMFSGLPDQKIFMLTDDSSAHNTHSLEYLVQDQLPPNLSLSKVRKNEMLLVHPAHLHSDIQELIPISDLINDSFVTSQDTELVNAARIAGAKKVKIFIDSKSSSSIAANIEGGMKTTTLDASSSIDVSESFKNLDKKIIIYEFQGTETGLMHKLKSKFNSPEKALLDSSKWLQYDEDLTEFVRSCFSDNKLKFFSKEISTLKQRNVLSSARLAIDCNMVKVHASAKLDLETKSKIFEATEKKYEVYF